MTHDQLLIFMLALDAAIIAIGVSKRKNMWWFIVMYWLILTVKNMMNFSAMM